MVRARSLRPAPLSQPAAPGVVSRQSLRRALRGAQVPAVFPVPCSPLAQLQGLAPQGTPPLAVDSALSHTDPLTSSSQSPRKIDSVGWREENTAGTLANPGPSVTPTRPRVPQVAGGRWQGVLNAHAEPRTSTPTRISGHSYDRDTCSRAAKGQRPKTVSRRKSQVRSLLLPQPRDEWGWGRNPSRVGSLPSPHAGGADTLFYLFLPF